MLLAAPSTSRSSHKPSQQQWHLYRLGHTEIDWRACTAPGVQESHTRAISMQLYLLGKKVLSNNPNNSHSKLVIV